MDVLHLTNAFILC